ncbi:MAG: lyase family protein, partial [Bowdeniella nasicola]|nr:lyase family protein [Bowdeniella nasicola]
MDLSALPHPPALTPLDGRYRPIVVPLVDSLSEAALNRARMVVEIEWLITLSKRGILPGAPELSAAECDYLRAIPDNFDADQIEELGAIEAETRHDVKAVEYFLKRRLINAPAVLGSQTVLPQMAEIVHIFCTSEDINNLAYALIIQDAIRRVWLPAAHELV